MTWHGPVLDGDQRDLVAMLDALAADRGFEISDSDPDETRSLVRQLAQVGVWTIGVDERDGGGGADWPTTALALERLGRHWPALGWAAVQAHAALGVLSGCEPAATLIDQVHAGMSPVAVVDAASAHIRLASSGTRLVGTIDRVDAAGQDPHLVVLDGLSRAHVISPSGISASAPCRTTGLDGAQTRTLTIDAGEADVVTLDGLDVSAVRVLLSLGAAAVAVGIMSAAVDDATSYATARHQFGGALTELPTVRQSLLSQTSRVAVALRAVLAPGVDPVQAWAVLSQTCDAAIGVAADALQSHGGYGYLSEYPVERRLRDAVSLRAATDVAGAAVEVARDLVGMAPHRASSLNPAHQETS